MKKTDEDAQIRINKSDDTDSPDEPKTNRSGRSFVAELFFSVLLIAAICAFPTIHLLAKNIGLVTFDSLQATMWIYMGISVVAFVLLRIFLRKPYFAGIFVALGTFLAVNFNWLVGLSRLFVNTYHDAALCGIVLYVILMTGLFFSIRLLYKKNFPMHILSKMLAVTFTGLVLFNVVLTLMAMGSIEPEETIEAALPVATFYTEPEPKPEQQVPEETQLPEPEPKPFGQPNVYFFILDEYGAFDIVSKYYDYDNKVFDDFLNLNGFNISRESYSTDNQTWHSTCDMLNLEYISRKLSKDQCTKASSKAQLYQIFSDLGYAQFQMSTNNNIFKGVISLNSNAGQEAYEEITMDGDDSADVISGNSISSALLELLDGPDTDSNTTVDTDALNQWGFYSSDYIRNTKRFKQHEYNDYAESLLTVFDYFEDPSQYTSTAPRVTYAYMTASHVPFLFDEYGGIISYKHNRNWENKRIYLNQFKFITKHMIVTLSTILANDPDSIIIVMSDHGIRYHADCNKKHTFYITDKDSCRIFNAVYIKGQEYDIEGLSSINTLRFILSLYEGLDYPPIDDPITSDSPDRLSGIIPKPR